MQDSSNIRERARIAPSANQEETKKKCVDICNFPCSLFYKQSGEEMSIEGRTRKKEEIRKSEKKRETNIETKER